MRILEEPAASAFYPKIRRNVLPQCWYVSIKLCAVILQNRVIFILTTVTNIIQYENILTTSESCIHEDDNYQSYMYNRLLELIIIKSEVSAVYEYTLQRHTMKLMLLGNT